MVISRRVFVDHRKSGSTLFVISIATIADKGFFIFGGEQLLTLEATATSGSTTGPVKYGQPNLKAHSGDM